MTFWVGLVVVLLIGIVAVIFLPARRLYQEIKAERARELFQLQREMLEAKFFELARLVGNPKGATWSECDFENEAALARQTRTGELVAFVEMTVRFTAAPPTDSDIVGTARQATAIFHYHHGQWGTSGRTLFDMTPQEAIEHFSSEYRPIDFHPHH